MGTIAKLSNILVPRSVGRSIGRRFPSSSLVPNTWKPFTRYTADSKIKYFLDYTVERIDNPTTALQEQLFPVISALQEVIKDCTGEDIPYQEVQDHLGDRLEVVRDGDQVIAFGTAKYFDHINAKNQPETVALLWGTMVKKAYNRLGLMVQLNVDGLLKAAERRTPGKTLFRPNPLIVRTQSEYVFRACAKHFEGVVPVGVRPAQRYQEIINQVAEEMGWPLNALNIQQDAYEDSRGKGLMHGLGERDAYVYAGDFTAVRRVFSWLMLKIIYPLKFAAPKGIGSRISTIC